MPFLGPQSLNPYLLGGVRHYIRNFWAKPTRFNWPAQKADAQRIGHKKNVYVRKRITVSFLSQTFTLLCSRRGSTAPRAVRASSSV